MADRGRGRGRGRGGASRSDAQRTPDSAQPPQLAPQQAATPVVQQHILPPPHMLQSSSDSHSIVQQHHTKHPDRAVYQPPHGRSHSPAPRGEHVRESVSPARVAIHEPSKSQSTTPTSQRRVAAAASPSPIRAAGSLQISVGGKVGERTVVDKTVRTSDDASHVHTKPATAPAPVQQAHPVQTPKQEATAADAVQYTSAQQIIDSVLSDIKSGANALFAPRLEKLLTLQASGIDDLAKQLIQLGITHPELQKQIVNLSAEAVPIVSDTRRSIVTHVGEAFEREPLAHLPFLGHISMRFKKQTSPRLTLATQVESSLKAAALLSEEDFLSIISALQIAGRHVFDSPDTTDIITQALQLLIEFLESDSGLPSQRSMALYILELSAAGWSVVEDSEEHL